jgi:hypothetical protein
VGGDTKVETHRVIGHPTEPITSLSLYNSIAILQLYRFLRVPFLVYIRCTQRTVFNLPNRAITNYHKYFIYNADESRKSSKPRQHTRCQFARGGKESQAERGISCKSRVRPHRVVVTHLVILPFCRNFVDHICLVLVRSQERRVPHKGCVDHASLANQRRSLMRWNVSMKFLASESNQVSLSLSSVNGDDPPSDALNVSWYLPVRPFGSLYPSQKMYGWNSLS